MSALLLFAQCAPITFAHMHSSLWTVWIAFPLCDTAGGLVSLAMWGFTWHFPNDQALVSSLFMASTSVSSCMAFVRPSTSTWSLF